MNTDLVLVGAPHWGYSMPHISLPALAASTRRAGFEVVVRDLSLELGEEILSPAFMLRAVERIEGCLARLDPAQDKDLIHTHEECLAVAASLAEHLDVARRLLMSSSNPGEVGYASNIASGALQVLSAAYAPAWITGRTYTIGGQRTTDLDLVLREAQRPDANPYFDLIDDSVVDSLLASDPRAVGISITSNAQIVPALTLAGHVRRVAPEMRIIVGGAVTSHMLDVLPTSPDLFDWLDYVVIGEGETLLNHLLAALRAGEEPEDRPGLWSRNAKLSPCVAPPENVLELPTPDYSDLQVERYSSTCSILPLQTTRGCAWGHCTFCGLDASYRGCYRERPIQMVVDDVASLVETTGARHITFNDEAIAPARTEAIGRALAEQGIDVHWDMMARLDNDFTEELLAEARSHGLGMIKWGLESASPRVLKRMGKGIKVDVARKVIRHGANADIWGHVFVLLGFPGETRNDFEQTRDFLLAESDSIDSVSIAPFLCVRGAPVFRHPRQFGIRLLPVPERYIGQEYNYEVVDGTSRVEAAAFRRELQIALACKTHLGLIEGLCCNDVVHFHLVDRLGRASLRRQIESRAKDLHQMLSLDDNELLGLQSSLDFEVHPFGGSGAKAVVMLRETGRWQVVNAFGLAVLSELQAGGRPSNAASRLAARYSVPSPQVERDCADFVRLLVASGIVTPDGPMDGELGRPSAGVLMASSIMQAHARDDGTAPAPL